LDGHQLAGNEMGDSQLGDDQLGDNQLGGEDLFPSLGTPLDEFDDPDLDEI
jgi:hypothetical protein